MEWQNGMDYLPIYVTSFPPHTTIISEIAQHNKISSAATRLNTQEPRRYRQINKNNLSLSTISPNIINF